MTLSTPLRIMVTLTSTAAELPVVSYSIIVSLTHLKVFSSFHLLYALILHAPDCVCNVVLGQTPLQESFICTLTFINQS